MAASAQATFNNPTWSVPFPEQDWHQATPLVQNHVVEFHNQPDELQKQHDQLRKQVDMLQGRADQSWQTSSKPPSSDSPFKKPKRTTGHKSSGKRRARKDRPAPGAGCGRLLKADVPSEHANRCKEAFFDFIEDGAGTLASDGYGVYQNRVNHRQTCLAHLRRTARGLSRRSCQ